MVNFVKIKVKTMKIVCSMLLVLASFSLVGQTRYDYYNTDVKKKDGVMRVSKDGELLTGIVFGTYKNGQLEFEENYVNGIQEGVEKTWYKNGQLMFEENYQNGMLNGSSKYWNKEGVLKSNINYIDGKKVK
jgi:antitoxin component YwqK of YwqJK toxin-antitoxin module